MFLIGFHTGLFYEENIAGTSAEMTGERKPEGP